MKLTTIQQEQLHELAFAEVSNKDIAEQMGLPLTEIHAARHRMGITRDKVAAAKGNTVVKVAPAKPMINKDFEAAVQQMESAIAEPDKPKASRSCTTCNNPVCYAKGTACAVPDCSYYRSDNDVGMYMLSVRKKELFDSLAYHGEKCLPIGAVSEIKDILNKYIPDAPLAFWGTYHD